METNVQIFLNSLNVVGGLPQDFTTPFGTPMSLNGYEIAVGSIALSYSWFNISALLGNNLIGYATSISGAITQLTIPDGVYGLSNINSFLQNSIVAAGGTGTNIVISANTNTLKTNVNLSGNYVLDLSQGSLWKLLGFSSAQTITTQGLTASPNEPNVTPVNMLLFHCDIVAGSNYNGYNSDILYGYVPVEAPGTVISITPAKPFYVPIKSNWIQSIRMYVTDNNNNILNLQGQPVTYMLLLRPIKKTDKILSNISNYLPKLENKISNT